jgi:hypothetical protein
MSELIEQLAKEHSSSHHIDETRRNDCHDFFEFTPSGLEAFAKAYQAAAPIPAGYALVPLKMSDKVRQSLLSIKDHAYHVEAAYSDILHEASAAAPIDNVAEAVASIKQCFEDGDKMKLMALVPLGRLIALERALIPDTQAKKGE